jgi:hypothetical protein
MPVWTTKRAVLRIWRTVCHAAPALPQQIYHCAVRLTFAAQCCLQKWCNIKLVLHVCLFHHYHFPAGCMLLCCAVRAGMPVWEQSKGIVLHLQPGKLSKIKLYSAI